MLPPAEAKALGARLENLVCADPQAADGLFHSLYSKGSRRTKQLVTNRTCVPASTAA